MQDGNLSVTVDSLAIETVVNLHYNGKKIASLLASPNDAKYLLLGHLVSEGYLKFKELLSVNVEYITIENTSNGIDVNLTGEFDLAFESKSTKITTTSCGACNNDGLQELSDDLPINDSSIQFDESILHIGMESMKSLQKGFSETGGMHSACLLSIDGLVSFFAEDIGRHNAVDKVIGQSVMHGLPNKQILLLSGRCGWDIVAKASRAGVPVIASIGACSSLAADCARLVGIKIYSFVKPSSHTIIG